MNTTSLYLYSPLGQIWRVFGSAPGTDSAFLKLSYTLTVNSPGWLDLVVPDTIASYHLTPDSQIAVMAGDGGDEQLEGGCRWIVRKIVENERDRTVTLGAYSSSWLLDTRMVAATEGSAAALKTDQADDLMKAVVREQLGSSATADRQLTATTPGYPFAVAADNGAGPLITLAFHQQTVLATLQKAAQAAAAAGTFVAFDVIWINSGYTFATYVGRRGRNRRADSSNPLLLDASWLGGLVVERDWTDEVTHITATGRGSGAEQDQETASSTAIGRSAISRRERLASAGHVAKGDSAALAAEANRALRAGRARLRISGTMEDAPGRRYGVDWRWGDEVAVQTRRGAIYNARLDSVRVEIAGGARTVRADLRVEE